MSSQKQRILDHFLGGNTLTALQALGLYGAFRLAARVKTLKDEGHTILTKMKKDPTGKPYAEYRLVNRNQNNGARKAA